MNGTCISHDSGTEGPRWDPYGWEKWTVRRHGHVYCLRIGGLSCWLQVDGHKVDVHDFELPWSDDFNDRERWLVECFERRVGMRLDEVEHYYHTRIYQEDPMGSLRSYE